MIRRDIDKSELDCLSGINPNKMCIIESSLALPSAETITCNLQDPNQRGMNHILALSIDQPHAQEAEILEINPQPDIPQEISNSPDNKLESKVIGTSKEIENAKPSKAKDKQQLAIQQLLEKQRTAKKSIIESQVKLLLTKKDTMDLFINEMCDIGPENWTIFTPLLEAYKGFCEKNSITNALNYQEFLRELRDRGFLPAPKKFGNRIRVGISLKPPGTEAEVTLKSQLKK